MEEILVLISLDNVVGCTSTPELAVSKETHFLVLIFMGVMSLGTYKILINDLVIATPLKLLIRFS